MENALLVGLSRQMSLSRELDDRRQQHRQHRHHWLQGRQRRVFGIPHARRPGRTNSPAMTGASASCRTAPVGPISAPARSSAPATRSTSPSTARAISPCRRRAASAIPATARLLSMRRASWSPPTAIRCSAPAVRSRFSTSDHDISISAQRHHHACATASGTPDAPARHNYRSSTSTSRNCCRRTARRHSSRRPASITNAGAGQHPRGARRGREIERARRRRDGAHDRDHAQLLRHRRHPAAAKRSAPQRVAATVAAAELIS